MAASGFTVLKLALRKGPGSDEFAMVKEISQALAPNAQVAIDALGAFTLNEAVRMGHELDRIGNIAWFEDALLPDDLPKYPELAKAVDTAICAGEMLSTRYQFRDLLIHRGARHGQPRSRARRGNHRMPSDCLDRRRLRCALGAARQVLALLPTWRRPFTWPSPLRTAP